MASDGSQSESVVHAAAQFGTTHWSTVLRAGAEESAQSQAAPDKLRRQYWYPVYAHIRHRGIAVEDARDLTQAFFFEFLQKGGVGKADERRIHLHSLRNGDIQGCPGGALSAVSAPGSRFAPRVPAIISNA